jgi:putative cardiolipin synthase
VRPALRRLSTAVFVILLAAAGRADVVRILDAPREAMQARVDVIRQAKDKIGLLYFLARDDRITLGMLALLRDARRRGVSDVRVIVDGSFHRIPKAVLAHLGDEGVQVRVYHPLDLRHPSWLFRRMHEKVIVADGARYITGGRNLGESYFGLARKNFLDRDVYVEGASAADADQHFEALWSSKHVAELRVRVSAEEKRQAEQRLGDVIEEMKCSGLIELDTMRDWSAARSEIESVRFIHDHVGGAVLENLGSAKESIVIESPYFIPTKPIRDLLVEKLASGVRVVVLTNSLHSTDGLLPQAAYLKYRRQLARAGVDFREYKGPDTLHAKSIIVDGRVSMIGSYNIDPRSQFLNSEVMCVAEDEDFARELLESIDTHIANAWTVQYAAPAPRISRATSLRVWAVQLLLPLIEPQL